MCIILHMHIFIVTQVILYESYSMTHIKVIQGHPHISFNVSARAFSSCSAFSIVTHIGDFIFKTFSSGPSTDIIIFFERSAFLKSHGQCHGSKWAVNSVVIAGTHNRMYCEIMEKKVDGFQISFRPFTLKTVYFQYPKPEITDKKTYRIL